MTTLRATVRLQLHAGFDLAAAAAQVPYYAALGVSHLYLSPVATSMPGSTHGYDAIDPTRIDPELGGEPAFDALADTARAHGLGLLLDIVPNHVAADPRNPWWRDVLRHGRRSHHARFFDIDWDAPGCGGRLWLPILDRPLAQALADGLLVPGVDAAGEPVLAIGGLDYPLVPDAALAALPAPALADALAALQAPAARAQLQALVEAQPWRPAWWRTGNDRINYRRFFDISGLAALRVEERRVFEAVHALPLRLVQEGRVDGLRIDHVDGLADPGGYLRRLRAAVNAAARGRPVTIHVEKILAPGEVLPAGWPCDGTTGYDFMAEVSALQHDPDGESALREAWRVRSGRSGDFAAEARGARREMLAGPLAAEAMRTRRALAAVVAGDPVATELGEAAMWRALCALLTHFPVYRTYAARERYDDRDHALLAATAAAAVAAAPHDAAHAAAIAALLRCMGAEPGAASAPVRTRTLRRRIEQLSAPLNAKSVEDTAFYRHGVLLSRNEVGADPAHWSMPAAAFHAACGARGERFPQALLATATHDHKRGEDLRARLAVLSDRTEWWLAEVAAFDAAARPLASLHGAATPGDTAMLWQMLVAAWPLGAGAPSAGAPVAALPGFAARIREWQRKALREAKLATSWVAPDEAYETAAGAFVDAVLVEDAGAALRARLAAAADAIAPAGAVNGLAQAVLRMTVPGVPDLYQGSEDWDLSLVDPDNRRAVDHARRARWLDDAAPWPALSRDWRDGRIKARTVARLLALRRQHPGLFAEGEYHALDIGTPAAGCVLAFERRHRGLRLRVAVPLRAAVRIAVDGDGLGLEPSAFAGMAFTAGPRGWRHLFTDASHEGDAPPLATLFRDAAVAVLIHGE